MIKDKTIYRLTVKDIYDTNENKGTQDENGEVKELSDEVVLKVIKKIEHMSFEDMAQTIAMFIDLAKAEVATEAGVIAKALDNHFKA
jgi:predicted HTH domain antitoxin